jgi:putative ABC transport system permease protein
VCPHSTAHLLKHLRDLPGVQAVTISGGLPPTGGVIAFSEHLETDDGAQHPVGGLGIPATAADAEYFDVLRIPIIAGRKFGPEDVNGGAGSVIVDPDLAAFLWPGLSPLGRRFRRGEPDSPWLTVVGVAGDVKMMGPDDRQNPFEMYYATTQQPTSRYRAIAIRASGNSAAALVPQVRDAVRTLDPDQPVWEIATAESRMREALDRPRFVLVLMSIFTTLAVVLAAIGVYGVTAYLVAQRTREIGVRIALGATRATVLALILKRCVALTVLGTTLGSAAALGLSRYIQSLLFGVEPTDPVALSTVMVLLGLVALGASLWPALRASRISPLQALRVE